MSRQTRTDAMFFVAALVAVFPFVLKLAGMPGGELGEDLRLYVGNLSKLLFLVLAAFGAARSAASFEADNPMRSSWRIMALGLAGFAAGEAVLVIYQAALHVPSPFPSAADFFFLPSYPLFLAGLLRAIHAYGESGYPIGSPGERAQTAGAAVAVAALAAYPMLKPVVTVPAPALEMFLNVAYPVLDLALLVPVVVLLRIAIRFRGGEVWKVWAGLLAGLLLSCAADVFFAYSTASGRERFDALSDVLFILSYAALARGALGQYHLLKA
jgi:hypothetical protein